MASIFPHDISQTGALIIPYGFWMYPEYVFLWRDLSEVIVLL